MRTLRVLSFNLRYDNATDHAQGLGWARRLPRIEQLLRTLEPDLIGFQEVLPHQRADLEHRLAGMNSAGEGRDPGGGGEACPLFWNPDRLEFRSHETFWLNADGRRYVRGWDAQLPRICTTAAFRWEGRELRVYNVHLDHAGAQARTESLRLLDRRSQGTALVMGDFNESRVAQHLPRLTAALGRDSRPTFHDFGRDTGGGRIDHIFVSPDLRVEQARVVDGDPYASDHYPVLAVLSAGDSPLTPGGLP